MTVNNQNIYLIFSFVKNLNSLCLHGKDFQQCTSATNFRPEIKQKLLYDFIKHIKGVFYCFTFVLCCCIVDACPLAGARQSECTRLREYRRLASLHKSEGDVNTLARRNIRREAFPMFSHCLR